MDQPTPGATRPSRLFNRNYLLQWQGQSVAMLGYQAFAIAMLFWIKRATNSATLMGLLGMVSSLPGLFLSPVGGTLADRYSRRLIIIISDLARGLSVLALVALLFLKPDATDVILVVLFVVAVFNNVVNCFFGPAISASIPDLVPKGRVASANSLGQLSGQLSTFIGQGAGGVLFRVLGAPVMFLITAIGYLYAGISECFVSIPQTLPDKVGSWQDQFRAFGRDIRSGLDYIWHRPGLREAVMVSAANAFFTAPLLVLLPFYVEDVLQARTDWYGFLAAATAVGALAGYLTAGVVRLPARTRGRATLFFILMVGIGYGLFGLVRSTGLALVLAALYGFAAAYVTINITTVMQVSTPGEMRGRVFGLLAALSGSLTPVAMGLSGVVADAVHQNISLIYGVCGAAMTLIEVVVAFNPLFRDFLASEQAEPTRSAAGAPAAPAAGTGPASLAG